MQKVPTLSDQFVFDRGVDSILAMMFVEELEGIFGDPTFRLPIEIILNKRFGDFEPPELIFIENKNRNSSVLPQVMLNEIENTLLKNQQIIIFRNRSDKFFYNYFIMIIFFLYSYWILMGYLMYT